jgi:hypothetical protein
MTSRAERARRAKQSVAAKSPQTARPKRDRARVIANTQEILDMARSGLAAATGADPRQRRPGLMNLFTYGRSVTLTIQTMKHVDPSFEAWWKPYQDKMAADPLMKYFNTTRTDVLHEGELQTWNYTVMGQNGPIDLGQLLQELGQHAPPNTIGTFFGDQHGGNGWEVLMPDGTRQTVYFQLPEGVGIESGLQLPNPPNQHDGQPIEDTSIANLGSLYLGTLTRIVDEFVTRFGRD